MKFYKLKCPECGAPLEYNPDKPLAFCPYCGEKILIDDDRDEITINYHIDKRKYKVKNITHKTETIESDKYGCAGCAEVFLGAITTIVLFVGLLIMVMIDGCSWFN